MILNNSVFGWKMMQATSKILICETRINLHAPERIVSGDAG